MICTIKTILMHSLEVLFFDIFNNLVMMIYELKKVDWLTDREIFFTFFNFSFTELFSFKIVLVQAYFTFARYI